MKNFIKHTFMLLAMLFSALNINAIQYCNTPLTTGHNTIYLTCTTLSDGTYQIKITADVKLSGLGGSFCHINSREEYGLNSNFVLSDDEKTITCNITSTTPPQPYTPLYVLIPSETPNEVTFAWSQNKDIEYATCDGSTGGNTDIDPEPGQKLTAPLDPAPTPEQDQSQVMSVYSDSYTAPATWWYNAQWGQNTAMEEKNIQGNNCLHYSNFNYIGWEITNGSPYNVTKMEYLHADIWVADDCKLDIVPISGDGNSSNTIDNQRYTCQLEGQQWNSFNIDLTTSEFKDLDFKSIFQFKFDQGTTTEFFLDNVYFYTNQEIEEEPIVGDGSVYYGITQGTANNVLVSGTTTDLPFIIEYMATWNTDATVSFNVDILADPALLQAGFVFELWRNNNKLGDLIENEQGGYSISLKDKYKKGETSFNFRIAYIGNAVETKLEYKVGDYNEEWTPSEINDMNLALKYTGSSASASSTQDNNQPQYAIDGNEGSRWESNYNDEETLTLDLGKVRVFNMIQIRWEGAYAKSFRIETSNDNAEWKTLTTIEDQTLDIAKNPEQIVNFAQTTARYVKFVGTKRATQYGYSFYEFRVILADEPVLTTIDLTTSAYLIKLGDAVKLTAVAKDQNKIDMTDVEVEYEITPADAGEVENGEFTPAKAGLVSITAVSGDVHSNTLTLAIMTDDNLARNQTSVAGCNPTDLREQESAANDGDENTAWVTYANFNTADEWWYVDLGAVYDLTEIAILWDQKFSNYSTNYILQTRIDEPSEEQAKDDDKWETFITFNDKKDNTLDFHSVNTTGQYVRFHSLTRLGECIRLSEVYIVGKKALKTITLSEFSQENTNLLSQYDNQKVNVILERSFENDGYWYTLCLPFDMTAEQVADAFGADATLAYYNTVEQNGDLISLKFQYTNNVVAGTPYLFKPGMDIEKVLINGVTINNANTEGGATLMKFVGTYNRSVLKANQGIYFLGEGNYLYAPYDGEDGTTIDAFRAYFQTPNSEPMTVGMRARVVMDSNVSTDTPALNDAAPACQKQLRNGVLVIVRDQQEYNAQGQLIK